MQLTSGTSSGTVDEGALAHSTVVGSGDLFGTGTDLTEAGAVVTASGALSTLVNFGADGPSLTSPFQFTAGTASALATAFNTANPGITSHGETITSITETATTLTASTVDHVVFTMTLNQSTGAWTFTLPCSGSEIGRAHV